MAQIKSKCSLCISTYNWPAALYQCLLSVKAQSVLPGEVIIGDDGSTSETQDLIERVSKDFPVPLIHVWQPDDGFRLAAIRNKTFARASGNYIIQSDGDIIFHQHFIKDHLQFSKKGSFVLGSRCLLNKNISHQIITNKKKASVIEILQNSSKKHNGIRFISAAYINYCLQNGVRLIKYVLGANMAFWRDDIVAVNGYNETFTGWGKEDNDIALRLYMAGIKPKSLKNAGITFHLYHPEANKENFYINSKIYTETMQDKITFAPKGINQYL